MFLEDAGEINAYLAPLEAAWPDYRDRLDEVIAAAQDSVVKRRVADGDYYVPEHPLYEQLNISLIAWNRRVIRWAADPDQAGDPWSHGFDAAGRIAVIHNTRNPYPWRFVVYGEGYWDHFWAQQIEETQRWQADGNKILGNVVRLVLDDAGKVVARVTCDSSSSDPGSQSRSLERFEWENGRIVRSYAQSFNLGAEIPSWAKDFPPQLIAEMYRQVDDRLRESRTMRTRYDYRYNDDGVLIQVDAYHPHAKVKSEVVFAFAPDDTIESLVEEFAGVTAAALVEYLQSPEVAACAPYRYVVLQYSAEHPHCGLPTQIRIQPADGEEINPFDCESFPIELPWPPAESESRKTIESLLNRLQSTVESDPAYAETDAPLPYRQPLWKVSRTLYDALKASPLAAEDFAIYPVDDHGDVDPLEDLQASLPTDVLQRLLAAFGDLDELEEE